MRYFLIVLALSAAAFGQCTPTSTTSLGCNAGTGSTVIGKSAGTGSTVLAGVAASPTLPAANAQLPLFWATAKTSLMVSSYDVTKVLGAGAADYPCATAAACFASLQQEYCDWAFSGVDQNWHAVILHGTLIQTGASVTCSQTGATTYRSITLLTKLIGGGVLQPAKYFVFDSDTPLAEGTFPCSGAVDDTGVRRPPTGDISTWWTGGNYGCANNRGSLWTLEGNWNSGNAGMLVQAGPYDLASNFGPSKVIFQNYEFRPIPSNTSSVFPVTMAEGSIYTAPALTSQMPLDIHFSTGYDHGDATDWCNAATGSGPCTTSSNTGGPGNNRIATFIKLDDCRNCSVDFNYFDYIISLGAESHVIGMARNSGPFHISQNWCSGASTCIFGGGVAVNDPLYSIANGQVTSNRLTQPPSWVGANYNGPNLTLKNRIEFKLCQNCVFEGNFGELSDTSGGQEGQIFTFTPRNCSAGAICNNYTAVLQNLTIQKNLLRHSLTGISQASMSSYSSGNGGGSSPPLDHVTIQKNLAYDLGSAYYDQNRVVTLPFFLRTTPGGASWACSGTNAAGIQTFTCDISVDGLRQTQIRPGDHVVITHCSQPSWNVPADGTNVWEFTSGATNATGAMALSMTTPAGSTIAVANPLATGATATGCILTSQGAPFHQIVQKNTIVMQADAYPSACTGCPSTKNLNGPASITGGLATVTISGTPIAVPGTALVNIVSANISAYNCALCLVTSTTANTVTYQTPIGNRVGDTLNAGQIQQPPNNASVYNGGGTVKIFTDTGCSGAGPNNSTGITAINRVGGTTFAALGSLTGWPVTLGAAQIIVEVSGVTPASFNGTFYYQGQSAGKATWSQAGQPDETGTVFGTAAQMGTCPGNAFAVANTFKNNLVVVDEGVAPSCPGTPSTGWSGWFSSGGANVEGCPSGSGVNNCSENHLDASTSVVTNTDFPGRCMNSYMEMGGGNAGEIPPDSLTGPLSSRCAGSVVTIDGSGNPSCVGMNTMMNGAPFDANNANPALYVLNSASPYKAGGIYQADDGTDLGLGSFSVILNANHSQLYVCESFCGTAGGPYHD